MRIGPALVQRVRHISPATFDRLLALAALAATQIEIAVGDRFAQDDVATQLSALAVSLPLAWRRSAPIAATALLMAGIVTQFALQDDALGTAYVAAFLMVWSAARHCERTQALATLGIALVGFWAAAVMPPTSGAPYVLGDALWGSGMSGAFWALGRAFRNRRLRADALERRAHQLERDQGERARLAAAEERGRIARELHDIVAHNVSTMVVQAGAGKKVLERDLRRASEAFASIEASGRQALAEMRRLLGILHIDHEGMTLSPQPSLERLDALINQVRASGLPVELTLVGDPQPLPSGIDVSAFRIIQEALTNAIRHAGPAHVEVVVRYRDHDLVLEVLDDGQGLAEAPANGNRNGHGLVGMQERVSLYGGTLQTGSRDGGGYAVRASLPLESGEL